MPFVATTNGEVVGFAVEVPVAVVCQYAVALGTEYAKLVVPQLGVAVIVPDGFAGGVQAD